MNRVRLASVGTFFLFVLAVGVLGLVLVGGASADTDGDADLTVEPLSVEDRQPGLDDASFAVVAVSNERVDWLESITSEWDAGSFANCGLDTVEEFGIDRGNNNDGYETDEDLTSNVKNSDVSENRFVAEFYKRDDFGGSSTHVDAGDAIVSVNRNCFGTPDEPGWYQLSGMTTGSMDDGAEIEFETVSNYFWICVCEDESEAREELGPPPDEEAEATPTAEPSEDDESDSTDDADETGSERDGDEANTERDDEANTERDDEAASETATPAVEQTPTAEPTATPTPERWEGHVHNSPTAADGTGFGAHATVVALLASVFAYLARRRR